MTLTLLFSLLPSLIEAASCNFKTFSLPLKDIQVLPNVEDSLMRGIPVQAGTPSQDLVVLPWAELNNTWLYDYQAYCDPTIIFSDTICRVRRGNFFYENASTTYQKDIDIIAAGGASQETSANGSELGIASLISTSLGGTDTFAPGSTNLSNFPIGIPRENWDHGYTILHAMGMGPNSTYLNSLVGAGQIASRVWSTFWGRMWVDDSIDGSVILGGYDSEKVIGQNYTQPLDFSDATGCWTGMSVTITDIELIDRDGSTQSLFPAHFALPVCIVPQRQLLIEMPSSLGLTFNEITNTNDTGPSFGLHWDARVYNTTNSYQGDMSIQLSSGLKVTIPNDQYMVSHVYIERNGSRLFDYSKRDALFSRIGSEPATLGRYFLTSAYLMVNHDSGTFTLWQANPTTSSQLVPVVAEKTADGCSNVTGVVQPQASASATNGNNSGTESKKVLTAGAIAGIVIGSVVAMVAIGLGVLYSTRRKQEKMKAFPLSTGQDVNEQKQNDAVPSVRHELYQDSAIQEVQGSNAEDRIHEMDAGIYTHSTKAAPERSSRRIELGL